MFEFDIPLASIKLRDLNRAFAGNLSENCLYTALVLDYKSVGFFHDREPYPFDFPEFSKCWGIFPYIIAARCIACKVSRIKSGVSDTFESMVSI